MKAYPEYKYSGIDWLGEIPSHWSCVKLKYAASCNDEALSETSDANLEIKYVEISDVDSEKGIINVTNYKFSDSPSRARRITRKQDVIISTVRTYLRAIAKIEVDNLICSTGFAVLRANNVVPDYLFYVLSWSSFLDQVQCRSTGVSYPAISSSELINIEIPIPTLHEQISIAEYLNNKTSKIDALVAEKHAQVEDLRKYRMSLITETVTYGLNPTVELKLTSSEWYPKIPNNWKIAKFKYEAEVKANLVPPEDYLTFPQVGPDSIEKDTGRLTGNYRTVEDAGIISDNHLFFKGQIVYSKIRPNLNKVIVAPFDGLCSADMYPIETKNNINYLKYLMLSPAFVNQVSLVIQDRVKMPKINQDELGEIQLVIPPLVEQQQIAEYLDEKTAKIDALIDELTQQLDELALYRKAVISEAVTGKVDVRDWKPKD